MSGDRWPPVCLGGSMMPSTTQASTLLCHPQLSTALLWVTTWVLQLSALPNHTTALQKRRMDTETKGFILVNTFYQGEKILFRCCPEDFPEVSLARTESYPSLGLLPGKRHQMCCDWFRPILTYPPWQSRLNGNKSGVLLARKKGE